MQWHPTPVLLPGKSHGWRSLGGCSPWGHWELDTTQWLHFHFSLSCTGEGNGNPLQCSCLENPRGGVAWWAAVYGVAQSRTRLKRLSSSSSSPFWGTQSSVPVFWTINYLDIWDSTLESKTSEGHKEPHHTAPPSPGHTHTHTHIDFTLFPGAVLWGKRKTTLSSVNSARLLATNLQFSPQLQGPHSFLKGQVE